MESPITRTERRNKRIHHRDTVLFHGTIELSDEEIAAMDMAPEYRTTCRHTVRRWTLLGVTWIARHYLENVTLYLGEIVRTMTGQYRVHLYRPPANGEDDCCVSNGRYVQDVIADFAGQAEEPAEDTQLVPPLKPPVSRWLDPAHSEDREATP